MCEKDSKIHFCTCKKEVVYSELTDEIESLYEEKKAEASLALFKGSYLDTYIKWELERFVKKGNVLGEVIAPVNKLTEELNAEYLEQELNKTNLFDFDYTPKEMDSLRISKKYKYVELNDNPRPSLFLDFMSFNFESGKWIFGMSEMVVYKEMKKGKIKSV